MTIVHIMDRLMERQLDSGSAQMLLPAMRELEVDVVRERETEALVGDDQGRVRTVRFAGGKELATRIVDGELLRRGHR